jgi:hypothetical protein
LSPTPAIGRPSGYLVDTQMMAMYGTARERTGAEFDQLLQGSGLGLERVIETTSPVLVMEVARYELRCARGVCFGENGKNVVGRLSA